MQNFAARKKIKFYRIMELYGLLRTDSGKESYIYKMFEKKGCILRDNGKHMDMTLGKDVLFVWNCMGQFL
ncbi:hypothetical protein KXD40_000864 [Peronospora effusa]|nr:hypothetical protein KXD40_000864 [Peronospora effusa]